MRSREEGEAEEEEEEEEDKSWEKVDYSSLAPSPSLHRCVLEAGNETQSPGPMHTQSHKSCLYIMPTW